MLLSTELKTAVLMCPGEEGEIRTHGPAWGKPAAFEAAALNRSATSPCEYFGGPNGNRTRLSSVTGRYPQPMNYFTQAIVWMEFQKAALQAALG